MNRIHKPFVVGIKKPENNIPYKPIVVIREVITNSNQNNTHQEYENSNNNIPELFEYFKSSRSSGIGDLEDFKTKMEEDITALKQKVESISISVKPNKNNINNVEDINYSLQLIENLTKQLDDYKKITDERIEKLVKLFLIINSKIANLKTG